MKKLLIGCGVAVALVAVVLIGLGVFAVNWVQDRLPETERFERLEAELRERFGEDDAWRPPLDGVYDQERLARYVHIREQMHARGAQVAREFDEFARPDRESRSGILGFIGGTRELVSVVGSGMGLMVLTDSLLVEAGMGKGEFAHYNLLTVHGLLGVDVDAHVDALTDAEERDDARRALREMLVEYEREARRLLRAHIDNVLTELDQRTASTETDSARTTWREYLRDERARAGGPLPLTAPLPAGFVRAIEPWRNSLESTRPGSVGAVLVDLPLVLRSSTSSGSFRVSF